MTTDIALIEHAASLLAQEATLIRLCHTVADQVHWRGEFEAQRAHDDMKLTSDKLYAFAARLRPTPDKD